jgi:alkylation response protein AidB-like acyl-CoA dehydrogenase
VQTTARPSPDGTHFLLNGEKRYITSGGIAQVLTVMARAPVPGKDETAITAFIVTPDMPGFVVVEAADGEARRPRHGDSATGVS